MQEMRTSTIRWSRKAARALIAQARTGGRTRVLAVLLAIAALTTATACGGSSSKDETAPASGTKAQGSGAAVTVAAVFGSTSDPFFAAVRQGMNAAAKDLDVNVKILSLNNYDNFVPDMAKNYQTAIALRPDGVAAWNLVPQSFSRYVKQLVKSGAPVVEYNGVDQSDGALGYVVTDDYQAGVQAGKVMAAAGKKNGMCATYASGPPKFADRCRGFKKAMTDAGGTSVDVIIPGKDQNNPGKMAQDIQGALASHPKVDAIFTITTPPALGAITALANIGKTGKVAVGTVDVDSKVLKNIKDGKVLFALDEGAYLQGYYAIQLLAQHLRFGFAPAAPVVTGPRLIDKSNVQKALDVISKHPGIMGGA